MNFEEGQIIERDGKTFCVLDIIEYNNDVYILMSRESEKIGYGFFKHEKVNGGHRLALVTNEDLNQKLMEIYERRNLVES